MSVMKEVVVISCVPILMALTIVAVMKDIV